MKRDGSFRRIVKTPRIEWCKYILKSERVLSGFALMVFQILKAAVPDLMRNCPQIGRVDVTHVTIPSNLISFLPSTQYKFQLDGYVPKPASANFSFGLTCEVLH